MQMTQVLWQAFAARIGWRMGINLLNRVEILRWCLDYSTTNQPELIRCLSNEKGTPKLVQCPPSTCRGVSLFDVLDSCHQRL